MEGPSLVILKEELAPFLGQKIQGISGNSKQPIAELKNRTLSRIETWGKVLFLTFTSAKKSTKPILTKTHFMMFGSYRINEPKENRAPRVEFKFKNGVVYFYACSFLMEADEYYANLDHKVNVLSKDWDAEHALQLMEKEKNTSLCDLFLDQNIFAGSGNIIKNEVLFNLRLHPNTKLAQIPNRDWKQIPKAIHDYCKNFYEWKKKYELRRHWQVYRQYKCPLCEKKLVRESTGARHRKSFYCSRHQPLLPVKQKIRTLKTHTVLPMKNPKGTEARLDH